MAKGREIVAVQRVERSILVIRGQKVLLDLDLAELYGVEVKRLNEAVRRNKNRFPHDFMFQLTWEEAGIVRSQIATLQPRAHLRYRPYAFTQEGVAMLSSVLRSPRAVAVNIQIMRAFVRFRDYLASHAALRRKLDALERKFSHHDRQFLAVFEAIRQLMADSDPPPKPPIGYETEQEKR